MTRNRKVFKGEYTISNMNCKHENKKRLYARDQSSGAKAWQSTELFLCECGAVLETRLAEKKTIKLNNEPTLREKTQDALSEEVKK